MQSLVPERDFWSALNLVNSGSHQKKKCAGVFMTASDIMFGKNCLCYPRSGDLGSILA